MGSRTETVAVRGAVAAVLMAVALLAPALQPTALAFLPVGACCLPAGTCENLISFDCEARDGTFLGFDTSCDTVTCSVSGAPLLSTFGLIAAVAALGGLAVFRLRRS